MMTCLNAATRWGLSIFLVLFLSACMGEEEPRSDERPTPRTYDPPNGGVTREPDVDFVLADEAKDWRTLVGEELNLFFDPGGIADIEFYDFRLDWPCAEKQRYNFSPYLLRSYSVRAGEYPVPDPVIQSIWCEDLSDSPGSIFDSYEVRYGSPEMTIDGQAAFMKVLESTVFVLNDESEQPSCNDRTRMLRYEHRSLDERGFGAISEPGEILVISDAPCQFTARTMTGTISVEEMDAVFEALEDAFR